MHNGVEQTYMDAIRAALRDAMRDDPNVVVVGEDIGLYGGAFGVTRGLLEEFGAGRVLDFPISEAAMAGMATGAAMLGMRPVMEVMFMDFISLAVDALCNHAAKIHYMFNGEYSVPLVVRAPMGAGRGYGPSHSQSLAAWFAHVPGIKVVAPATVADAYDLLRASINDPNPVLFLEHKLLYNLTDGSLSTGSQTLGRARVSRSGTDVSIVTFSQGVQTALAVAMEFERKGISVEVVDLRTIRPLDTKTVIDSCRKTGRAVVLTEEYPFAGISSELCTLVQQECWNSLKTPVRRVTGHDTAVPCATSMESAWLPSAERLAHAIESALSPTRSSPAANQNESSLREGRPEIS